MYYHQRSDNKGIYIYDHSQKYKIFGDIDVNKNLIKAKSSY